MARHRTALTCGALCMAVALLALSGAQAGRVTAQAGIAGEIGPNDLRISTMGPDGDTRFYALDPAVACNPAAGEFLVVWAADDEAPPVGNDEFEIYGQRVAEDGTLAGARFRISFTGADGDPAYYVRDPHVVYNSTAGEYLVVWAAGGGAAELPAGEFEIYGQRLDATGNLLGGVIRISDMGPDGDPAFDALNPTVAYNAISGEYLVAWQGDDTADNVVEIYGQRLDAAAAEVGVNDFPISQMGSNPADPRFRGQEPQVVCGGSGECLFVWEGDTDVAPLVDDEYEIFGQRLAADGSLVGQPSFRISTAGPDGDPAYQARRPSVAYSGGSDEYLVVWAGDDDAPPLVQGELEIYGQRLASDGSPVGVSGFRISSMGSDGDPAYRAWTPTAAYLPATGRYFVAWRGDDGHDWGGGPLADDEREIFGQTLQATGELVGSPVRLSDAGPDGDHAFGADRPALAAQPGGDLAFVAWQGDDDVAPLVAGEVEILGQLVQVEAPSFPDIVVTAPPLEATLCPGGSAQPEIQICNVGTADLTWSLSEAFDWLGEEPSGGTLLPGGCAGVMVTFNTTGLTAGTYAGSLLIDSNDPDTPQVTLSAQLEVLDSVHGVDFTWQPPLPKAGDEVTFTGTAVGSEPIAYAWAFGDGTTGTGNPVGHAYPAFGDYAVTITASNACGEAQAMHQVTVIAEPDLSLSATSLSAEQCPAAQTQQTLEICNVGDGELQWSLAEAPDLPWLSADPAGGTVPPGQCTGVTVALDSTGTSPGEYAGSFSIESNDPDTPAVTVWVSLTVWAPPLQAGFTWSPVQPYMKEPVTFVGTAEGTGPIDFSWSFGDGMTGSGQTVTHSWLWPTSYSVVMTATNACGQVSVEQAVTVRCGVRVLHVHGIALTGIGQHPNRVRAIVEVRDQNESAVGGVRVLVQITRPGSLQLARATTSSQGIATFNLSSRLGGLWQICVVTLSKSQYAYWPDMNHETCDWIEWP